MGKGEYSCKEDILCGVNTPEDPSNLTDLEKKHLPVITAPDRVGKDEVFTVTVEVGKLLAHPNEPGHFIEWVELYAGDTYLFRVNLSGSLSLPRISIPVKLSHAHGPLIAWAKCNLHGIWRGEKEIVVE